MIKAKTIIFFVLLFALTMSCTIEGEVGPIGSKGPKGPIGNQGEKGYQGEKGDPGVPGIQGVSGPPGPLGNTGPKGQDAPQPQATIITINNTVFTIQEEIEIWGSGFKPEETIYSAKEINDMNNLKLSGVMTIPPFVNNPRKAMSKIAANFYEHPSKNINIIIG